MTSVRATPAAARMPADLTGRDAGRGLAGLIDVLDRADAATLRPRTHRSASRAAAHRAGGGRAVPLRSVRPAPPARPVPAPFSVVAPDPAPTDRSVPAPAGGPLAALVRRVALWGAGPQGEFLAWRAHGPSRVAPVRRAASTPRAVPRPGLRARLVARVALWGAGPQGEHLAWSRPRPALDRPVVLRELPSTPTVQPAVPSPAAALVPGAVSSPAAPDRPPARSGIRPPDGPVVARLPAGPAVPMPRARTSQPTGWPTRPPRLLPRPTASFPAAGSGPARSRGDPLDAPARGSPRPPPRPAPRAPG